MNLMTTSNEASSDQIGQAESPENAAFQMISNIDSKGPTLLPCMG